MEGGRRERGGDLLETTTLSLSLSLMMSSSPLGSGKGEGVPAQCRQGCQGRHRHRCSLGGTTQYIFSSNWQQPLFILATTTFLSNKPYTRKPKTRVLVLEQNWIRAHKFAQAVHNRIEQGRQERTGQPTCRIPRQLPDGSHDSSHEAVP